MQPPQTPPSSLAAILLAMTLGTSASLPAADWLQTRDLPLREASQAERQAILKSLQRTQIVYNFEDEDTRVLIHDGDLTVAGNFDNGDLLVVRGDLTVEGNYDDYRESIGVLVVEGDMRARNLYSWGAMRVNGDLDVPGVLMTVYNDFTFEVAGKVNSRLLLVSDKSSDYRVGEVEIEITDSSSHDDYATALRSLLPEAFTGIDHLELEDDPDAWYFPLDESWLRQRMHAGAPVFRAQPADPSLTAKMRQALAADLADRMLETLVAADPLLAQLVAARGPRSDALIDALLELDDPQVDLWLGKAVPERVARRQAQTMTPALARMLVENDATPERTIASLAQDHQAEVRALVARRQSLPDSVLAALADDAAPTVRGQLWASHAWRSAYGWQPGRALIDARIVDSDAAVRDAMVEADLDAAQLERLIPGLSASGLLQLANRLHEIGAGRTASVLDRAARERIALQLLALDNARFDGEHHAVKTRTAAFLALAADSQADRLDVIRVIFDHLGKATPSLDVLEIARHSHSRRVLEYLAAQLGRSEMAPLARALAKNPLLPLALQLQLVEHAATAKPKSRDDYADTPQDALDDLLQQDDLDPAVLTAVSGLILERGIRMADGSYQNSFFHRRDLPKATIAAIDREMQGSESWALTLMQQRHADPQQLASAMLRWYSHEPELQRELESMQGLVEDAFWLALAKAGSPKLREAALHPDASAEAVQWLIDHPRTGESIEPRLHRKAPPAVRLAALQALTADRWASRTIEFPLETWRRLAREAPTPEQRRAAYRRAGEMARRVE